MPSDKRARQRAAREAKRMAEAKRAKRRTRIRNGAIVVVLAALVILLVVVTTGNGSPPAKTTTTTTSTTSSSSTSSTTSTTAATANDTAAQKSANSAAVAGGCPASPSARVNDKTWSAAPAMTIDPTKTYKATVKTTIGTFVITLLAKTAPTTVNNFVFLADQGYYSCNIFHRVIPGFMDQTGDPTGTGSGTPGYTLANENVPTSYATGDVAMAGSGTSASGSQFFVTVPGGATTLDHDLTPKKGVGYSLFGKVTSGLTVAEKINAEGNATASANGIPPKVIQRIISVTIATS